MAISSFTGANFTGFMGQSFRFQILNDDGDTTGSVLSGQVKRIFRQGRQTSVELYIPSKKCTHTYEAKRIYYKGTSKGEDDAGKWNGSGPRLGQPRRDVAMVIRPILQPQGIACCAQACCAMLTNMELDEVCKEFGHQHSSHTKEVVRFLRNHGYVCPDRLKVTKKGWAPPGLCILKLRFGKRSMGHMVVYYDGVVYDPAIGKRLLSEYERMTSCDGPVRVSSYLPITKGAV